MAVYKLWPKSPPLLPYAGFCSPRMRGTLSRREGTTAGKETRLLVVKHSPWWHWHPADFYDHRHLVLSQGGWVYTQVALGQHWIRDPVVRVYSQIQSYIPSTEAQLMLSTLTQPSQGLLRHCYAIVYSNCPFSGLLIKIQGWPPGHSRFVSITEIQAQHLVPYL